MFRNLVPHVVRVLVLQSCLAQFVTCSRVPHAVLVKSISFRSDRNMSDLANLETEQALKRFWTKFRVVSAEIRSFRLEQMKSSNFGQNELSIYF